MWFNMNWLRLNPAKTQIIWLRLKRQVEKVNIMATSVQTVDSAPDLGVVDSQLSMTTHVSAMCSVAYYQLQQLHPLISLLSCDAAKLLVQAFISTCLDYCNLLLYRINDNLYRRLQAIQDAAARLITNMRRCEHIMPVLQQQLH